MIFKTISANRKEVHIVFDVFRSPSIKDYEHDRRGEEETHFDIKAENKRQIDLGKLLRSSNFKIKFVEFLIDEWKSDSYLVLCLDKKVMLNYDKCYSYTVSQNKILCQIDYDFCTFYEEADTKIVYTVCQLLRNYRVEIHCTDSDIPVIMLANFKYRKADTRIVINMSTSKKKSIIDINLVHQNLGDMVSRSLAGCHIFTGNDFNPAFYRKGKKRPFTILKTNTAFQEAFINLIQCVPSQITLSSAIFKVIEEYVCRLYSLKVKDDVNKGRFEMFAKTYKFGNDNELVLKKKIKACDASCLPPSKEELLQQIKRTAYISSIWCNAHMRNPTEYVPEECGWSLIDGRYEYYWFDGPESPAFSEILGDNAESDDDYEMNNENNDDDYGDYEIAQGSDTDDNESDYCDTE